MRWSERQGRVVGSGYQIDPVGKQTKRDRKAVGRVVRAAELERAGRCRSRGTRPDGFEALCLGKPGHKGPCYSASGFTWRIES